MVMMWEGGGLHHHLHHLLVPVLHNYISNGSVCFQILTKVYIYMWLI